MTDPSEASPQEAAPAHDLVAGWPVVVRIPVQWGEMDAYGHVNNTVFFRYFESARVRYLERCGFTESWERDRVGAILHSTDCRFRRALTYPDEVLAAARAGTVEEDRFTMDYRVVSLSAHAVAGEGSGLIVSFDYEAERKAPIPPDVREGIERLEQGAGEEDGEGGAGGGEEPRG